LLVRWLICCSVYVFVCVRSVGCTHSLRFDSVVPTR
jgi:hypothetical protein